MLRAGTIHAGDPIEVIDRPAHGITIGGWFAGEHPEDARTLLAAEADGGYALPEKLRHHAERALRRVRA